MSDQLLFVCKMYNVHVYIEHHDCLYDYCSGVKTTVSITDGGKYNEHDINVMLELLEKMDDDENKIVVNDKTARKLWISVSWKDAIYKSYKCNGDSRYD